MRRLCCRVIIVVDMKYEFLGTNGKALRISPRSPTVLNFMNKLARAYIELKNEYIKCNEVHVTGQRITNFPYFVSIMHLYLMQDY